MLYIICKTYWSDIFDRDEFYYWTGSEFSSDIKKARRFSSRLECWPDVLRIQFDRPSHYPLYVRQFDPDREEPPVPDEGNAPAEAPSDRQPEGAGKGFPAVYFLPSSTGQFSRAG